MSYSARDVAALCGRVLYLFDEVVPFKVLRYFRILAAWHRGLNFIDIPALSGEASWFKLYRLNRPIDHRSLLPPWTCT